MKNLAGVTECDDYIVQELLSAEITIEGRERSTDEVSASIVGRLGKYTFTRAWYYWCVTGKIPIKVATEMYKNPVGRADIRVNGNCGCPSPRKGAVWYCEGKVIIKKKDINFIKKFNKIDESEYFVTDENPAKINGAEGFVESYHIDSQEGLNLFVETLKKHGLV